MAGAEDVDRRLPRYTSVRGAVALGSLLLASLILWSALTDVEIVVTAPAAARPVSGVAELRAPDARPVDRVLAGEGEPVTRGEVIVVLDSRLLDAQWESASRALEAKRRALADIRSEVRLLESGAPPDAAPTRRSRLRIVEHRSRIAQLDDEVHALESELDSVAARSRAARRLLAIARQRHRAAEAAFAGGALSRFDLLQARQELLSRQADLDSLLGRLGVLGERLSARRNARLGTDAGHRQGLLETAAALEVEVAELETRLAEVGERRRLGRITSPADGVLDQLLVRGGDFVERGERLAVVVPAAAPVVFETRIEPRQAAFLHAGQSCRIKLDALPFARYGALPCTVGLLGRDVVEPAEGPAYYLARVRPAAQDLEADGRSVRLQPGATARVDIVAGRRTVLSFFTEPLRRFARESLRER